MRIAVHDPSRTSEARRIARNLAVGLGFDEVRAEQIAIVVTEACTNLLKHAGGGEILIAPTEGPRADLEVLAIDRGPGMSDLEQCIADGFSTGGSPGQGLGAIRRLSSATDFYTAPGKGTLVLARWASSARNGAPGSDNYAAGYAGGMTPLSISGVSVAKRGEELCGDSWCAEQTGETSTILVADGLGHGPAASEASLEAVRIARTYAALPLPDLLERVHHALRSSRGAAVAVARIDRLHGKVSYCGVGNISAQIYSGWRPAQHLASVNGTAGHNVQRFREFSYPWPENGMLVMHSDGLLTAAGLERDPGAVLHDAALIAGLLYRDFSRDLDDATVVVAKAA